MRPQRVVAVRRLWMALALAAVVALIGARHAQATTLINQTIPASTKAVKVTAAGVTVAVDKVANPTIRVDATGAPVAPSVAQQNNVVAGCATTDDPANGTLNRRITVTPAAGGSATIYVLVSYQTENTAGTTTMNTVEPLGAFPGTTFTSPVNASGTPVPIEICVA